MNKIKKINWKYTILLLFILLIIPNVFSEDRIYFEIENDDLIKFGVLDSNNLYYLNHEELSIFAGMPDGYVDNNVYSILTYDTSNNIINNYQELVSLTIIKFNKNIKKIKIQKNNLMIIEKEINFCNNNNICESCKEDCFKSSMINYENSLTCPTDCKTGEEDNYCDLVQDDKCDPDCNNIDNDCNSCNTPEFEETCHYNNLENYCMYEFDGIKCSEEQICKTGHYEIMEDNTQCCVDSYCINSNEFPEEADISFIINDDDEVIDKEQEWEYEEGIDIEISQDTVGKEINKEELYPNLEQKEIEKYDQPIIQDNNIKTIVIIMIMFIIIAIIVGVTMIFRKNKKNGLDKKIEELHNEGVNYSKIKQNLVRRGHHDYEIDKAIEDHYKKSNN
jgi:hypothetical protein